MTEVIFHFNAPDKVGHACGLLRKMVASGSKVVVTGEAGLLRELDAVLWTFSPLEFIPHCLGNAPPAVLSASPVVLTQSARTAPHHQRLLNLGASVPDGFERFERLVEVVTVDPEDRGRGRERWAHYKGRGYAITTHDLVTKEAA